MTSWAALAAAEGRITAAQANAVNAACKEFRIAHDYDAVMERAKQLVARAEANADAFADLQRRIDRAVARGLEV